MGWNKAGVRDRERMLSCILKNQMLIMQVMQTQVKTYEHTSRFGSYYSDKLSAGINDTADILHMRRKKSRGNCPYKIWNGMCRRTCALCDAVNDEECLLDK